MPIELQVNGIFTLHIKYLNGKNVGECKDKDIEQGILDNLQQGEYVIGMDSKSIYDINDLTTPLYTFEICVEDSTEYVFSEETE